VSRGITAPNILRGIHESMATRLAKLLKSLGKLDGGVVQMTGGLALDSGLVSAMQAALVKEKLTTPVETHEDAIYAGAIGAALWGAFRWEKLQRRGDAAQAA
jgi:benzoyl-CoA reductase subunit D